MLFWSFRAFFILGSIFPRLNSNFMILLSKIDGDAHVE